MGHDGVVPTPPAPDAVVAVVVRFVRGIGLGVERAAVAPGTPLPGVTVRQGVLVVDPAGPRHPGDVLHEAGHLAVLPPARRAVAGGRLAASAGEEMAAIAWSYAAAVHLGLPASAVFHAGGYRGGGAAIAAAFETGGGFGVPVLAWYGMAAEPAQAARLGVDPYPAMLRWLR